MRWTRIVCGCALALFLGGPAAAQQSPLVGTWTSALNPNTPATIFLTLAFAPDGRLQERWMNRQAVAFEFFGSYSFDPGTGTLSVTLDDYAPRQLCTPYGSCQPVPPPTFVPFNQPQRSQIKFESPNLMIGTASDGSTLTWLRQGN
jgi:hypothetical protein